MTELVAIDMPGGSAFVDALRRVWDRGDAAFPVDQRHPAALRDRMLSAMRPSRVIDRAGERRVPADAEPLAPGDALVVATSGSTGDPKGVVLTHDALRAHARAVHERLAVDPATDRWLACLPLAHVGGLGVVVRALVDGVALDVLPGFDATAVQASAATLVSLVPTALDRVDPGRFRWVVLGGSADPRSRPANVVRTYGLTETGGGVYYSVGGLLAGTEMRLVEGEVQLRGPTLLRCYRDGSDPRTPDGWLPTGDLGELTADGTLRVHGRRSDMIVTGGENVWPTAVEVVLARHPAVAEVVVTGRPDPEWGAIVVARVVPAGSPPTLDELRAFGRAELPGYALPRAVEVVDAIERTALGKPIR